MRKKDTILILTNSLDGIHSDVVINKLKEKGEKVFRLDTDTISGGKTKLVFSASSSDFFFTFQNVNDFLHSEQVKSVWYRRPNDFDFKIKDAQQKDFAEAEMSSVLEGMWVSLDRVYWLNTPEALERARKKILQLQIARKVGFLIPDTLITNFPESAREFMKTKDEVISKALNQGYFEYENKSYTTLTTLLNQKHLKQLYLIKTLPTLFQNLIKKAYELRVTIIHHDIYAFKLESQLQKETAIDWRNPKYIHLIPHTLVTLPSHVRKKCLEIMKFFKLNYGAIDLIVDTQGNYIFLEINPNGQWYWLEHLTKTPLTDRIVKALVESR